MMKYPEYKELNAATARSCYISSHYPDFYSYLIENFPKDLSFNERLYWFYNKITNYPTCKTCGKRTKFINCKTGYREFCSYKCLNTCNDIQERKKRTSLKHYGVDNPMQCKIVRDKLIDSNMKKYGVDNPFRSEEIKKRIMETNIKKYGVPYVMQNKEIAKKVSITNINKILKSNNNFISYNSESDLYTVKCPHNDCDKCIEKQFTTPYTILYDRIMNGSEICTKLLPIGFQHTKGSSLELFVRRLLDKYSIKYQTNVRNIIPPKELDIYIPSHKLAIECNGCFWHDVMKRSNNYHIKKYIDCQNQGIQLITIWEDWIINKPEIITSIILSKLGIFDKRLYARQCAIKEIGTKEANDFLNKNHIQGKCQSKIRFGLYYKEQLVSVMSFSPKNRMSKKDNNNGIFDLSRFCNLKGYQIIGGASKLLKHFIIKYNPLIIESFSSNDISNGHLYEELGFVKDCINESYWYIDKNKKRYHRSSFTKDAIVKKGWKDKIENSWTETEVMREYGYVRIQDSGQTKWILKIK